MTAFHGPAPQPKWCPSRRSAKTPASYPPLRCPCRSGGRPGQEELADHATQERFVYYHRWRVGDVLIWDERATMHRGAGDYRPDERRIMLRTIVYPN